VRSAAAATATAAAAAAAAVFTAVFGLRVRLLVRVH
jgi:hypothetical protein